jgi:predicted DNA-binding transcriptional regulator AlpA
MLLPEFDPLTLPAEQIPAAVAVIGGWLTQLAARQMTAPALAASTVSDTDRMLTVKEVAERLRCSTKSVYRRAKTLPFARHNGSRAWIFSERGLTKWLARQRV